MSQPKLKPAEAQLLQESINSDAKIVNIRLRKGEYQYELAKGIASFEIELRFPDVKDLTKRLYGEKRADETHFVRKIQTILKKMERNDIVKILPKNKPWELQRYALSSFKFRDVDKNRITLATPQQIKRIQNMLPPELTLQDASTIKPSHTNTKILTLVFVTVASYIASLWALIQPTINPIMFIPAFYIAVAGSLKLGKLIAQK